MMTIGVQNLGEYTIMLFKKDDKDISDVQVALLLFSEVEYLYEFCEIFGKKRFLKFLDIFSNQVIRVPSREELREHLDHVLIWTRYTNNHNKYELADIAKDTGYTKKEVLAIYEDLDKKFKRLGISFGKM